MDLTAKKCRSKTLAFAERVADFYEKTFPEPPDQWFWCDVNELDTKLGKDLSVRPLPSAAMDIALKRFGSGFKAAAKDAHARRVRATAS